MKQISLIWSDDTKNTQKIKNAEEPKDNILTTETTKTDSGETCSRPTFRL